MKKNQPAYEVQDIPTLIQEVLMTYGEKEHIGESEYLRIFSNDVLKKLKKTPALEIKNTRIRVPNYKKFELLTRSYVKYQLNLL